MSVSPRVLCQHDARVCSGIIQVHLVLLGEADMFVPVEFFNHPIEHRTQVVGHTAAALGKPNGRLVALCMSRIDYHMPQIVGVALGKGGAFVLSVSDAIVEEQVVTLAQLSSCLFDVLMLGILLLSAVLPWAGGHDCFVVFF